MSAHKGIVKHFDYDKNFGFIAPNSGGEDVFVHKNNVIGMIQRGEPVMFDIERTAKGFSALNVIRG